MGNINAIIIIILHLSSDKILLLNISRSLSYVMQLNTERVVAVNWRWLLSCRSVGESQTVTHVESWCVFSKGGNRTLSPNNTI